MKKLLLLGALLVVGATSFAYDQAFSLGATKDDQTSPENTKAGNVGLFLRSKGSVVAPAENEYILQIAPTKTSETSTDSIVFDFTDLAPGVTKVVDGAFEARILKGTGAGTEEVDIPTNDSGNLVMTSVLQKNGTDVGGVVTVDLVGANTGATPVEVGTLTYTLTSQLSDAKTYTGNIKAELAVVDTAVSSTFNDSSAGVVVKVEADAFKGTQLP